MRLPPENPYGHTKKLRYILDRIPSDSRVLDFGTGNGLAVTSFLSGAGHHVLGIEPDLDCREFANAFLEGTVLANIHCVRAGNYFPVVVCADVIEHLENPLSELRNIASHQESGGLLLGSVPNGRGLFEIENRLFKMRFGRLLSTIVEVLLNPRRLLRPRRAIVPMAASPHLHFFSIDDLHNLAHQAGYLMTDIRPGVLLGSAPFTCHILEKSKSLMRLNGWIADRLPLWAVSTWLFTWRKI